MKKRYSLVVKARIIDAQTMKQMDDNGLKALDGYFQSPPKEFDSLVDKIEVLTQMSEEFREAYSGFHDPEISIVEVS